MPNREVEGGAVRVRLRLWRERRLLSQRELAALVGMSQGSIARIERGHHRPRLSTIRKLAQALDVTPDELVEWDAEGRQDEPGRPG